MIAQKDISRNTNAAISTAVNKRNSQSQIVIETKKTGAIKASQTTQKEKDHNMNLAVTSTDDTDPNIITGDLILARHVVL